ncbi:MAG: HDIG domain-containing protein, partial [bacterium]|nr:HDIG domain-containing protein [bacterium]
LRDSLLGRPHKDHDLLVTGLPLPQLKALLGKMGRVLEVGKSFGVLKFKPQDDEVEYDIALPRKEKSVGTGHRDFEVQFDADIPVEIDLGRRDFTINAMARDLKSGEIVDPFGGQSDLEMRILKQVFSESFSEDPLRLMRAIQFAARFNLSFEEETYQSLCQNAGAIETVSPERIIEEVGKLFKAEKPSVGFYLMKETGLLKFTFPELERTIGVQQPNKIASDVFDHTMMVLDAARSCEDLDRPGDLEIMFASLFHDIGKPDTKAYDENLKRITFYGHQVVSTRMARKWMRKYRANMLGIDTENVLSLVYNHMFETKSFFSDKAIRRFIHKIGKDLIFKLLDLRIADKKGGAFPDKFKGVIKLKERIIEEINRKPPFGPKDLALNGSDLMEMGYPEGPILGQILKALVELVLDDPSLNTRESLEEYTLAHFERPQAGVEKKPNVFQQRSQSQ